MFQGASLCLIMGLPALNGCSYEGPFLVLDYSDRGGESCGGQRAPCGGNPGSETGFDAGELFCKSRGRRYFFVVSFAIRLK
jgi:hypothetical protein